MSLYRALDARLRGEDVSQFLSVFLLLLALGLVFSWSGNALTANDSWYTVTAISRTGLGLLAIYSSFRVRNDNNVQKLASFLMLLCVALVTVPFGLVSFAASHPIASLPLSLAFDLVFPLALFGLCLVATGLLPRAAWLAPILCLAIVALAVTLDELIRYRLFSPISILGPDNWPLVLVWAIPALATPLILLLAARREP